MSDTVIVALIGVVTSIVSALISAKAASSRVMQQMQTEIAVMQSKMDNMSKSLESHNGYARMFSEALPVIKEQIIVANKRIADLESGQKRLESFHLS